MRIKIAAVCLAALCVLCGTGCDGSRKVKEMVSVGLYSGEEIVFPIESNRAFLGAGHGIVSFHSKQDPDVLRERIESRGVAEVSAFQRSSGAWGDGDSLVLLRRQGDGTSDHFSLLVTSHTQEGFFYILNPMGAKIGYAGEGEDRKSFALLLPLHLMRKYDAWESFYMDVEYETSGSPDVFFDFYSQSGWFNLQKEENGFLVRGFRPGVRVRNPCAQTDFAFRFVFRRVLDLTLFQIVKA